MANYKIVKSLVGRIVVIQVQNLDDDEETQVDTRGDKIMYLKMNKSR